jgi:thiosulfate/3-mercaptopyruvate sulfurtransferase
MKFYRVLPAVLARFPKTFMSISSQPLPILNPEAIISTAAQESVKFLDGSWHLTKSRLPNEEYTNERIAGAKRFDIDECSNKESNLPHMLPSADLFARYVSELGISNTDHVVVYTTVDSFSAARVWWMFRVFGHNRVSVLNGGLKAWKAAGGATESGCFLTNLDLYFKMDESRTRN